MKKLLLALLLGCGLMWMGCPAEADEREDTEIERELDEAGDDIEEAGEEVEDEIDD